ncbi:MULTISPECIES: hypothetical protein [unclassified Rhizobium]|uniref:hypothetical protein n=1 Tax=unclassified Rhizobium TaxID=2613769 RepID=UPI000714CAA6|nr:MULTISPECIES: hypothetical protein [unclassified Rhizobium]KQS93365.1 hypothetical protein ASG42_30975 [Rhizobium sp. Leaf391]KQT98820.1 hypothetical protein ASG68_30140 [Rhizobium sp. Leaf453]
MSDDKEEIGELDWISLDIVIGCLKLAAILTPVWLALLSLVGGSDCRNDCAVGMGMAFIALLGVGLYILPIGLPVVFGLLYFWTRGRPVQLIGGIVFIPALAGVFWGYLTIREIIQSSKDAILSSEIEAAIRPEYLSRTISKLKCTPFHRTCRLV